MQCGSGQHIEHAARPSSRLTADGGVKTCLERSGGVQ